MAEEVVLDLEELRQLQNIAKRPRVLNLISSEICNLEKLRESASVSNAKPEVEPAVPVPVSSSVKPVSPAANYATLGTFSWDQDNEKVKVYISLEGVDEDKIKPSLEKEKDPMAGIMDMMKNMYEGGDEEMKKTIAKAWTDARSGKAGDSLKGL
ncbi:PREDICTED: calcyclin-binding protein isoform X2 [Brassica oleracea var. oleracea]|uniref:calcyclin-binding protein isoform X2 n=1 Tax=Brassica oleracea var. oleracea TaxID=109376 RepID=UPI0006A6D4AF|nr:PREDICTED: calcyclin-binding protein isoform X2 [Brassica oleracea var. oleracea]